MFLLTVSTASAIFHAVATARGVPVVCLSSDADVASNSQEYLSDKDTIEDDLNYVDEDSDEVFRSSLSYSFATDSTDWTEPQEQIPDKIRWTRKTMQIRRNM